MAERETYHSPLLKSKDASIFKHNSAWFSTFMFPTDQQLEAIRNFPLNDEDVMVVSFPKSGTTWTQQIVWLIINGVDALGDDRRITKRFPFLEYYYTDVDDIAKRTSPRLIKSHMPYGCLPAAIESGRGKVIYVARNVKDVCVSYYYHHRIFDDYGFHGSFRDFYELFKTGRVGYGPWQDHVCDFWDHRHDKNVLFLIFEDMLQQHEQTVVKIAEFLRRSLTAEQLADIVQRTTFDFMRTDPSVNYSWRSDHGSDEDSKNLDFLRKGVVGDWMNYFTADMEADIFQCCIDPAQRRGLIFTDRPSPDI